MRNCSHRIVTFSFILSALACRREEEDLTAGARRGPCATENRGATSAGAGTADALPGGGGDVLPPAVQLTPEQELVAALQAGNVEEVRQLFAAGTVGPGFVDEKGRNALMIAAEFGRLPLVEFLISVEPMGLEATDLQGRTAAEIAAASTFIIDEDLRASLVRLLSGETLSPEEMEAEMLGLLQMVESAENMERIKVLLEKGASPDAVDRTNPDLPLPALFLSLGVRLSAASGRPTLGAVPVFAYAEALVRAGADLNATVIFRRTPLTPLGLAQSPGAATQFADRQTEWLALLGATGGT
jgi:hypothetical protein